MHAAITSLVTYGLLIAPVVSARLAAGEERQPSPPPHPPISAVIVRSGEFTQEGISHTTAVNIVDRDIIKKLEAFFTDYGKFPSSQTPPSGWKEGYLVYFNFGEGKTIEIVVAINDNGGIWSMGHGDLVTKGNFAKFVKDLERRKTPERR
jgi:hypothetical protein